MKNGEIGKFACPIALAVALTLSSEPMVAIIHQAAGP